MQGLRQQALAQVNENEMVIQELGFLEEDAKVFKLIGPVLVQQDLVEVKANVNKRVDYIKGDVTRIDKQLTGMDKKIEEQRNKVRARDATQPSQYVTCALTPLADNTRLPPV